RTPRTRDPRVARPHHPRLLVHQHALHRPRLPAGRRRCLFHRSRVLDRRTPRVPGRVPRRARRGPHPLRRRARGRGARPVRHGLPRRLRALPPLPLLLLRPQRGPRLVLLDRAPHPDARARRPSAMRVVLVPANQERSPDPVAPLGVCYVASAAAEAGHEVHVLDLCFSEDPPADVRAAVAAHRPEAIGISLRNVDNCAYPDTVSYLPHYRAVVQACRTASEAPIVLGGSAFTTMPAHYLAALDVPYGVVGEGEVGFPALLARLAARAGACGLAGIAVRDTATAAVEVAPTAWLPAVDAVRADRRWIDNRRYFEQGGMGNLQTKRGCHYKCTFCAYPVIEGRGMRTRDPEGIAAEVAALLD